MITATIILAVIGMAVCVWGVIKDNPPLQSLGVLFAMISLILAIISQL